MIPHILQPVLKQVLCHQVQVQVQEVHVQVPVPVHEVQVQVQEVQVPVQVSTIAQNFIILNISQKSLVSLKCTESKSNTLNS